MYQVNSWMYQGCMFTVLHPWLTWFHDVWMNLMRCHDDFPTKKAQFQTVVEYSLVSLLFVLFLVHCNPTLQVDQTWPFAGSQSVPRKWRLWKLAAWLFGQQMYGYSCHRSCAAAQFFQPRPQVNKNLDNYIYIYTWHIRFWINLDETNTNTIDLDNVYR